MNHKKKVKLARRLRTKKELKSKVPIFQSNAWEKRRKAREDKVEKSRLKKLNKNHK